MGLSRQSEACIPPAGGLWGYWPVPASHAHSDAHCIRIGCLAPEQPSQWSLVCLLVGPPDRWVWSHGRAWAWAQGGVVCARSVPPLGAVWAGRDLRKGPPTWWE